MHEKSLTNDEELLVEQHADSTIFLLESDEKPANLKLSVVPNPLPKGTLCDIGIATEVSGPSEFLSALLIQKFDTSTLAGIDPASLRVFRWNPDSRSLETVWNSGVNVEYGFVWSKIQRPGVYLPIGLPHDGLLRDLLQSLAIKRRYEVNRISKEDMNKMTLEALQPFIENVNDEELNNLRKRLVQFEIQHDLRAHAKKYVKYGRAGHVEPFVLPHNATLTEFRERLNQLEVPLGGLPEESLFYPPEAAHDTAASPEWKRSVQTLFSNWMQNFGSAATTITDTTMPIPFPLCIFFSPDWWMYHHDFEHSGHASGCSDIKSTYSFMLPQYAKRIAGNNFISIPSIVNGKIYIGSSTDSGGGTLYKIDLISGVQEATFFIPPSGPHHWGTGTGGSPAIVEGKVYLSSLDGKVYCLDANTLTQIWVTDIRLSDLAKNQPLNRPDAACWTSPLVVNGKVYVGSGLGEDGPPTHGFIHCLDATTGRIVWIFCTNKFDDVVNNSPNVIPPSTWIGPGVPPAQFTVHPTNPSSTGASVWSSCAYDSTLKRIYVATGNPQPDGPLSNDPTKQYLPYATGVLALDANTGAFKGFFQPLQSDSYRANDNDIDMPSSPLIFTNEHGERIVAIGSKNGSFFLLHPKPEGGFDVIARRQLLPKAGGNGGFPGDTGALLPNVDPAGGADGQENHSGIYGTAAVHYPSRKLFVGLGGWGRAIDYATTPFMRVLDWNTLKDAWATNPNIIIENGTSYTVNRYTIPRPPMYTTPGELGLSSAAIVNDVVFVTTNKPALYALDVNTGLLLWSANNLPKPSPGTPALDIAVLGPAIYGNYVVIGCGDTIYVYKLFPHIIIPHPILPL